MKKPEDLIFRCDVDPRETLTAAPDGTRTVVYLRMDTPGEKVAIALLPADIKKLRKHLKKILQYIDARDEEG